MATLRMLATACGPEFCLDIGKSYTGVPADLAKTLCATNPGKMEERFEVNGKTETRSKVIGPMGPYAELLDAVPKGALRFQRRDPNKTEE